jgi:hypothetical protein
LRRYQAYIWHAGTKAGIVQDGLAACGFETRSQIIWAKNNFTIGRGPLPLSLRRRISLR